MLTLNSPETSNTVSDRYTDTIRIFFFHVKCCIRDCLFCCCHCILAEQFHTSCRFRIHILFCIKIFYFRCEMAFVSFRIKFCDLPETGFSFFYGLPELLHTKSDRSDRAHSCYHYSSAHNFSFPFSSPKFRLFLFNPTQYHAVKMFFYCLYAHTAVHGNYLSCDIGCFFRS